LIMIQNSRIERRHRCIVMIGGAVRWGKCRQTASSRDAGMKELSLPECGIYLETVRTSGGMAASSGQASSTSQTASSRGAGMKELTLPVCRVWCRTARSSSAAVQEAKNRQCQ
jgi:hypothetical protein